MTSPAAAWAADEASPTELAIARRLFKEATDLETEGEWELAASKLREALQIKDTPGLRFHLAHCEERMGQLVEAMLDYDRARELIAGGARAPDVESLLEPARRALEQRLPTLLIVIPAGVPELAVEINGRKQARSILGRPAPLNPGKYRVVVTAPNHQPFVQDVVILQGDRKRISAELSPLPLAQPTTAPPASTAPVPPAAPRTKTETRTYVLVAESAVTVAALGVGVGFLFMKNSAQSRIDSAGKEIDRTSTGAGCGASPPPEELRPSCEVLEEAIDDYNQARAVSTAGFVAAGVGAVSIGLTALLWPTGPKSAGSRVAPRARLIRPVVHTGAHGTFLALSGRF